MPQINLSVRDRALPRAAIPLGTNAPNDPGIHPLQLMLRQLETHAFIQDEDRKAVLALPYRLTTMEPNSYVVREGDQPILTGVLLAGFAFKQKLTGQGTRQIVGLHLPGDPLGLQNLFFDEADHSVQALTQAKVALIPRIKVQELVTGRPALSRAFFISAMVEASIFREWILNIGSRDARSRITNMLCEWLVRLEARGLVDQYGYELPMTQMQIADALGLTSVHVNRTLKVLERDGVLMRDRGRLSFPDRGKLFQVARFDPAYLHLRPQQTGLV